MVLDYLQSEYTLLLIIYQYIFSEMPLSLLNMHDKTNYWVEKRFVRMFIHKNSQKPLIL
jgi:hypothetical protein